MVFPVVGVGLFARSHRSGADPSTITGFFATYTGDTLWTVLFFLLGRTFWPRAGRWRLLLGTLALTQAIEFAQLWKPPFLQWLRSQPIIGFLLGNSFVWSDVVCLCVGGLIAVVVDTLLCSYSPVER